MAPKPRKPSSASPTDPIWRGVRLRRLRIGADPDAPRRDVRIPALWDDDAGAALAALAPGEGAADLPEVVDGWALALAERTEPHDPGPIACALADAILCRRFAPDAACWRGAAPRGFSLRLSAFTGGETAGAGGTFDLAGYEAALALIARLLPGGTEGGGQLRLTDLDAALAGLGLAYDSAAARASAAALAAIATARLAGAEAADAPVPRDSSPFAEVFHDAPAPLADAAARAWRSASAAPARRTGRSARHTTVARPDAVDPAETAIEALLGVEARGIAPVFAPVAPDGSLRRSTLARLAAASMTPEQALARMLSGDPAPLVGEPRRRAPAHLAMHAAIAPFLDLAPPKPLQQFELDLPPGEAAAPAGRPRRRELSARHKGFTQKVTIGGHRLFLRTGEYDDGSLGEIEVLPAREGAALRGAIEAFAQAVTIALQYGVPLDAFVDGFAHARFGGSAGPVEGDPQIAQASSVPDYVFRTLAAHYLGRTIADPSAEATEGETPLLPMALPIEPPVPPPPGRRRGRPSLRLVS
ncbi:hypothetical protein FHR90_000494 [Endobacter medicaginis]|uniref:ribonucleoside-diphosphate reductase n=3 Tax=Endobacter medicaginis TaxID=1181271 RepID=A0A839UX80_9PROT|nr:vitamin B12-dependent ribonucleotide reductase [Endobacter medicaginis]MBB3172680.1 hypothetical protein [Endobacter medicaginis]MCX5475686.1 vitamin B12-dependent ribonucleotide reductase [Endobacter medicaginis]